MPDESVRRRIIPSRTPFLPSKICFQSDAEPSILHHQMCETRTKDSVQGLKSCRAQNPLRTLPAGGALIAVYCFFTAVMDNDVVHGKALVKWIVCRGWPGCVLCIEKCTAFCIESFLQSRPHDEAAPGPRVTPSAKNHFQEAMGHSEIIFGLPRPSPWSIEMRGVRGRLQSRSRSRLGGRFRNQNGLP